MNEYETIGAAVERLAREGAATEARLMSAMQAASAREVLRCLDPRHGTTPEQAHAAVFDASPYAEAAAHAREVLAR